MSAILVLCSLLHIVAADDSTSEFQHDPYLAFRPQFARSLPVQIMLTGVVLTLVAVLFIHLMFTAQYHWPLAPVNYVLQLSGVTTLLISLIATIHVVLSATFAESEKWPYMLSYIAVNVPPLDIDTNTEGWSVAERATWLVMNASTSGLIQITHIQFLTLLYPSKLEGRLIFALLGPLAVVAAVMQLLPISGNTYVNNIASAVRNVCNATLSLLFTLALFIWGLLVNRRQAWRTDGGTAVFGCAALSLAVVSTALNFLYVHKEEEFVWLPALMWAVVLWQSFLGWWWWVGAGSGGAFASEDENMEDKLRRQAKRDARRREKREKKKEMGRLRSTKLARSESRNGTGMLAVPTSSASASGQSLSRSSNAHLRHGVSPSSIAPREISHTNSSEPLTASPTSPRTNTNTNTNSTLLSDTTTSASSYASSSLRTRPSGRLPQYLPGIVWRWYASLRREHNAAARVQAAERVERMRELGAVPAGSAGAGPSANAAGPGSGEMGIEMTDVNTRNAEDDPLTVEKAAARNASANNSKNNHANASGAAGARRGQVEVVGWGWGWEGFGWRRRQRRAERDTDAQMERDFELERQGRSRGRTRRRRGAEENGSGSQWSSASSSDPSDEEEEEEDDMYVSDEDRRARRRERERERGRDRVRRRMAAAAQQQQQQEVQAQAQVVPNAPTGAEPVAATRPRSVWWWGPLWRWRLQDSTVYR